jgi:2-phosphosulfolactate phosphatase
MKVDLLLLPDPGRRELLAGRACAVFDVLRATTTITAALAVGVEEIHLFDSLDAERRAAAAYHGPRLLCGEQDCLAPSGFDLGNSPGQFNARQHRGAVVFMCTTNGTRALLSARGAELIFAAALVNAAAVADALHRAGLDVTLLCAGTNGQIADEDVLGAGAVAHELLQRQDGVWTCGDLERAVARYRGADPLQLLRQTAGGRNITAAGLDADIAFAARVNALGVVGVASGEPLVVRRYLRI